MDDRSSGDRAHRTDAEESAESYSEEDDKERTHNRADTESDR